MSRILGIVFGVLIVITGVYSLMTPIQTYGVVGWLIAFAMIADGIGKVMVWFDYRKLGVTDVWALVGGILSVVLGCALAGSQVARAAVDIFVAYIVGGWLLVGGVVRIARSFSMRKVHNTLDTAVLGTNWDLALCIGILMVILGIFCLANPLIVMVALGWQVGIALIMGGVGLITATA